MGSTSQSTRTPNSSCGYFRWRDVLGYGSSSTDSLFHAAPPCPAHIRHLMVVVNSTIESMAYRESVTEGPPAGNPVPGHSCLFGTEEGYGIGCKSENCAVVGFCGGGVMGKNGMNVAFGRSFFGHQAAELFLYLGKSSTFGTWLDTKPLSLCSN